MSDVDTATAAARRAQVLAASSSWRHGTITETSLTSDVVALIVDGNTDATPALNRTGQYLRVGTRVQVVQPAAGGTYVLATTAPTKVKAPSVTCSGPSTPMANNTLEVLPVTTMTGDTNLAQLALGAVTVNVTGRYDLDVVIEYDVGATGHRLVEFLVNTVTRVIGPIGASVGGAVTRLDFRTVWNLNAGDLIAVRGRHAQGAVLNGRTDRWVITLDGV